MDDNVGVLLPQGAIHFLVKGLHIPDVDTGLFLGMSQCAPARFIQFLSSLGILPSNVVDGTVASCLLRGWLWRH